MDLSLSNKVRSAMQHAAHVFGHMLTDDSVTRGRVTDDSRCGFSAPDEAFEYQAAKEPRFPVL
eukprot:CAMPEP_0174703446 /NCGR_PEP_ID=MMETSP1094-20130205/7394_1 /TAXON_ID=156173 /ORGANISM="Chrysochromulina brevifilum, Strain UTEX LB 985" /LENGTH=62 /DNA_ID=CAMNT_0015901375 /DNA_START=111 /DNA_END=296 /DNA_ORIENTATION=-